MMQQVLWRSLTGAIELQVEVVSGFKLLKFKLLKFLKFGPEGSSVEEPLVATHCSRRAELQWKF